MKLFLILICCTLGNSVERRIPESIHIEFPKLECIKPKEQELPIVYSCSLPDWFATSKKPIKFDLSNRQYNLYQQRWNRIRNSLKAKVKVD